MALSPTIASGSIKESYKAFVTVDEAGLATGMPQVGDFPSLWANAYDTYASAGIVISAINEGGEKGIIEAFMRGATSNTSQVIRDFAIALASYWTTVALKPGDAMHGGNVVVSIVNNAMAFIPAFEAAIIASMTDKSSIPWFFKLVSNVQSMAVSKILWTITEVNADGTIVAVEPIN